MEADMDYLDETRLPDTDLIPDQGPRANENLIVKGHVRERSEPVIETRRTKLPDGSGERVTIIAGRCAGCEEIFHSNGHIGGACAECGKVMCTRCIYEKRCRICDRSVCLSHGTRTTLDGQPVFMCYRCNRYR